VNTKPMIQVGIAFVLLGIVAFTYHWGNDMSGEIDVGANPIQAGVDSNKTMPITYVLGGVVLVGGIILVAVGVKKSPQ